MAYYGTNSRAMEEAARFQEILLNMAARKQQRRFAQDQQNAQGAAQLAQGIQSGVGSIANAVVGKAQIGAENKLRDDAMRLQYGGTVDELQAQLAPGETIPDLLSSRQADRNVAAARKMMPLEQEAFAAQEQIRSDQAIRRALVQESAMPDPITPDLQQYIPSLPQPDQQRIAELRTQYSHMGRMMTGGGPMPPAIAYQKRQEIASELGGYLGRLQTARDTQITPEEQAKQFSWFDPRVNKIVFIDKKNGGLGAIEPAKQKEGGSSDFPTFNGIYEQSLQRSMADIQANVDPAGQEAALAEARKLAFRAAYKALEPDPQTGMLMDPATHKVWNEEGIKLKLQYAQQRLGDLDQEGDRWRTVNLGKVGQEFPVLVGSGLGGAVPQPTAEPQRTNAALDSAAELFTPSMKQERQVQDLVNKKNRGQELTPDELMFLFQFRLATGAETQRE